MKFLSYLKWEYIYIECKIEFTTKVQFLKIRIILMNTCNISNDSIVVTGVAGFIGFHLSCKLIREGFPVIGVDNINSYYDVSLKEARLKILMNL